ncbi:hypothetical protein CIK04_03330 [Vibrio sp. 03_296]|uniref:hypothetical protein n=1 Tax=Vibrio TaxID=662 RepID=UPI000BD6B25F|nr:MULTISPECIES: hypothetical protein [Vibrio]NVC65396.1 hypothetical protein [Vibrio sp. 05-20-BW147]OZT86196.1 hypothetical protein CIK04_03330 [Vibrio sp. 03_296]PJO10952.1 hypothetical protein COO31_021635 [Vibrio vulnificus]
MLKSSSAILLLVSWSAVSSDLPSTYVGIEVSQSTYEDVLNLLGPSKLQRLPQGHSEKGYCYIDNVTYVVFGGHPIITRVSVHDRKPGLDCSQSQIELPSCIGDYCLGISKAQSESILGQQLEPTTDGSGSYVQGYDSIRPISQEEKDQRSLPDKTEHADVTNNIWFKYANQKAVEIGVYKYETY